MKLTKNLVTIVISLWTRYSMKTFICERSHRSDVFIVNFEHISLLFLVFLSLTFFILLANHLANTCLKKLCISMKSEETKMELLAKKVNGF